jgi:flagellar secretion chaperone FliS
MYADNSYRKAAARHYADVHTNSGIEQQSPHRLIQMLMEGFLARINSAKGAMEHKDFEAKSRYISQAIGIVSGLNDALDMEAGGELALNLRGLYDYMGARLITASAQNSQEILNELAGLMREIKEAWDAIA